MNVETAQRLADLRRSKGFSQEGLARKLGLSRQAVSKWERAESSPDTENLISLAKLYGVSLDEFVRGGLNSIPRGQFEAAQSQGFGFFATMRYIILPQTFKTIIPALFSQCTTVIKDSSYLSGINVAELMYTANVVMAHAIDMSQVLMLYGLVFAMYFVLNFGISLLVRAYQRRMVAA